MKRWMQLGLGLVLVVSYACAGLTSYYIIDQQQHVQGISDTLQHRLTLRGRTEEVQHAVGRLWHNVRNRFSAPQDTMTATTDTRASYAELLALLGYRQQQSYHASWLWLAILGLGLPLAIRLAGWRGMTLHLTVMSAFALAVGLCTPLLSVKVSQDIPVIGEIIFQHSSRTILSSIAGLWQARDYLLAGAIALFSVVLPLLKLAASVLHLLRPSMPMAGLQQLSKWSMVDVFSVAVLVAVFSLNTMSLTDAHVGFGVYAFGSYCLLALLSSTMLSRVLKPARTTTR